MIEVLGGVALAAFLFSALLWSIYRAVVTSGFRRQVAIFLSLNTVFGMIALTMLWQIPAQVAGGGLIALGLIAVWTDPGWSKLLPFIQVLFGAVLIVGLPWIAG